jgi:predicted acylesterase/phospholipase RssA
MRIFVFPVSGGAFPVQLGLIAELYEATQSEPHIALGSSGGNVAAYVGLAAKWKYPLMVEIVTKISSSMFARSWWPSYFYLDSILSSGLIGFFKGSFYAEGKGTTEFFKTMFTPESIGEVEIWTGTLNRMTGKGEMFCNRKPEESLIRPRDQDTYASLFSRDCMPLNYMNRHLDLISQVTMASASIPLLVPERTINGQEYVDGGTLFASPLTALQDEILETLARLNDSSNGVPTDPMSPMSPMISGLDKVKGREALHLNYFSSFDLQATYATRPQSMYDNGTATVGELIKSLCIQDRLAAIEILRTPGYAIDYIELEGNQDNLKLVHTIRQHSLKSLLELYPSQSRVINLTKFTGADITDLMTFTRQHYRIRFWYIRPESEPPRFESARQLMIPRHRH